MAPIPIHPSARITRAEKFPVPFWMPGRIEKWSNNSSSSSSSSRWNVVKDDDDGTDGSLRNVCTEIYLSSFFRKTVLPSLPVCFLLPIIASSSSRVCVPDAVRLSGADGIYGSLS